MHVTDTRALDAVRKALSIGGTTTDYNPDIEPDYDDAGALWASPDLRAREAVLGEDSDTGFSAGALDLKLRKAMQLELKSLNHEVGITFIFVTHDQEEALTMSDRVAVFNAGRIEQIASPAEIYEQPATEFVAGFVGTTNLLTDGHAQTVLGHEGTFSLRPEKIHVRPAATPAGPGEIAADGVIETIVYLGSGTRYIVALDSGITLMAHVPNRENAEDVADVGSAVTLLWDTGAAFPVAVSQDNPSGVAEPGGATHTL